MKTKRKNMETGNVALSGALKFGFAGPSEVTGHQT